jgi:hypothetical protein
MYFASNLSKKGIMIRLLLVLAPALAMTSGIGVSSIISHLAKTLKRESNHGRL